MNNIAGYISIVQATAPSETMRILVDELEDVLAAEYPPEQRHGLPIEQLLVPEIRFFIAHVSDTPAGCGGVALLDGFAEVKRMYVRQEFRGRGVAQALMQRLEETAAAAGRALLRLETGTRQIDSHRFYGAAGFRRCGSFGVYSAMTPEQTAGSVFMEKRLDKA